MVNSGNANAYTGKEGYENVKKILNIISSKYNCKKEEIIISSTGVIGEQLPINNIKKTLTKLSEDLTVTSNQSAWKDFANSIMTTDTFPKAVYKKTKIGNKSGNIIGIAKGSGMIAPNMATMLAYVFTDLDLPSIILKKLLIDVNEKSFNSITVDSDMSTNDMVCFFSTKKIITGISSVNDVNLNIFKKDLELLTKDLAKKIVYDGEGATKLIEINVRKAKTYKDAKKVAFSIANSPLVKTAIAGEDANWGRVIMAIGKSKVVLDQNNISLKFGKYIIINKGKLKKKYNEKNITKYLKNTEIYIEIELHSGIHSSRVWTCDLTKKYIEINADYRS